MPLFFAGGPDTVFCGPAPWVRVARPGLETDGHEGKGPMENIINLLLDAKVLTGVAALIALAVLFLLVVSSNKRRKAKMREVPETPVVIEQAKPEMSAERLVHAILSDRKWRAVPVATLEQHIGGYQDIVGTQ